MLVTCLVNGRYNGGGANDTHSHSGLGWWAVLQDLVGIARLEVGGDK